MKIKTLLMAGILSGLFSLFGYGKEPAKTNYPIAEIYKDLRNQVLLTDPAKIGLNTSSYVATLVIAHKGRLPVQS